MYEQDRFPINFDGICRKSFTCNAFAMRYLRICGRLSHLSTNTSAQILLSRVPISVLSQILPSKYILHPPEFFCILPQLWKRLACQPTCNQVRSSAVACTCPQCDIVVVYSHKKPHIFICTTPDTVAYPWPVTVSTVVGSAQAKKNRSHSIYSNRAEVIGATEDLGVKNAPREEDYSRTSKSASTAATEIEKERLDDDEKDTATSGDSASRNKFKHFFTACFPKK